MRTFDNTPARLTQPSYTASLVEGVVRVVDYDDGHRSVTNAAEEVVAQVIAEWPEVRTECMPIIYRDSGGQWDQLLHSDGVFTGYRVIRAKSEDAAVASVRAKI